MPSTCRSRLDDLHRASASDVAAVTVAVQVHLSESNLKSGPPGSKWHHECSAESTAPSSHRQPAWRGEALALGLRRGGGVGSRGWGPWGWGSRGHPGGSSQKGTSTCSGHWAGSRDGAATATAAQQRTHLTPLAVKLTYVHARAQINKKRSASSTPSSAMRSIHLSPRRDRRACCQCGRWRA